jgi:hypothetical protein
MLYKGNMILKIKITEKFNGTNKNRGWKMEDINRYCK